MFSGLNGMHGDCGSLEKELLWMGGVSSLQRQDGMGGNSLWGLNR